MAEVLKETLITWEAESPLLTLRSASDPALLSLFSIFAYECWKWQPALKSRAFQRHLNKTRKPLPVVSNIAFKRHNRTERSQSKTKVDHHHCPHGTTCRFSYSQRVTHLPPINSVISLRLNPDQRAKQHKVIRIQLLGFM